MHIISRLKGEQFPEISAIGELCYDINNGSYYMATDSGAGGTMWTLLKDSFDVEIAKEKIASKTIDETKPSLDLVKELRYKVLYKVDFIKNYKLEEYVEKHEQYYKVLPSSEELSELENLLTNPNVFLLKGPNAQITYIEGEAILSTAVSANVYKDSSPLSQNEISKSKYTYYIFLYSHGESRWAANKINPTSIISLE